MLSDEELDRYARHIVLPQIGGGGQMAISKARVLVTGAGGIASGVVPALAGAGIAHLRLVDDDVVSLSNLQRQTHFTTADIGRPKVEVSAERATAINPHVTVEPISTRVTAENMPALAEGIDLVIDGTDNFATRLIVSDALTRLHIPLISAAIVQFQGQIGTFTGWLDDKPCYRCFVGDALDPEDCDTCAEQGVLSPLPAMIGSFAAAEALRLITGFGEPATGKLHVYDGLEPSWRTMRLPKDPGCSACGSGVR